ncbi:P-loop containing nucleoside triphosphate hydrolase protein [Phakopsora pachyrhizi]|nr:P-loop containing nucleoside triphosphate hydrolase protein [Phakopsora pachyrhizi]
MGTSLSDEDTYVPYVPVKKRKEVELNQLLDKRLGRKAEQGAARGNQKPTSAVRQGARKVNFRANETDKDGDDRADEDDEEEDQPVRPTTTLLQEAQVVKRKQAELDAFKTEDQKKQEEEAKVISAVAAHKKKLGGAQELAKGVQYHESMKTSWRPPSYIRMRTDKENSRLREKLGILVEGDDCPPPIEHFQDMRLPNELLKYLKEKKIKVPSPIQLQGLPVALSGRDMIGIAFTGSGKTLAFSLPLLLLALEAEMKLSFIQGEGPVGIIVCPSRELARQTYEGLLAMAQVCAQSGKYPQVGTLLCIGGISMADQSHVMSKGFHIIVATPGRLQDMLEKRKFNLDNCKYLCLDEADRMVDMGFEDDVRNIMSFFKRQRQTLLFSATMPKTIRDFAENSLVKPIVVNVGRAGAANLDVIQEVEYVKQEAKMVYLLECLQKTPPPVIIFSENKNEVDDIQEYLLLKGIEAVAIHGSKTQEEREYAIKSFKSGKKDVMVASGVASKGLDFAEIQHVINFTMPSEIENYVHQIGRTGRSGKTGIATTFINMNTPEQTLLDLKYLLMEAKQRIPPFLQSINDPNAGATGAGGCQFCGGLGHSALNCPKREDSQRRERAGHHREDGGGGGY